MFLTNPSRLAATYGPTDADNIATKLTNLVNYLETHPALGIDPPSVAALDAYPAVASAYDAWDAQPVLGRRGERRRRRSPACCRHPHGRPGLTYVTLVGGDDILPMGRVPDLTRISNESDYASTFGDVPTRSRPPRPRVHAHR